MARALAGAASVTLEVAEPATLRAVLVALGARHPALLGTVLDRVTCAPIEPNLVLLDGRRAAGLDTLLAPSDRPVLLFVPSGG
jgi:hypothetical protein